MTLRLERVPLSSVPWAELEAHPEVTVAQTRAWLDFLAETQRAEPVAARVLDGTTAVGWYRGALVHRFGVRILGSPLRGWTTAAMGFVLDVGVDRAAAVSALQPFAFDQLRCLHIEVADAGLAAEDAARSGLHRDDLPGWQLDLRRSDDDLLAGMNQMARRNIRKAEQAGVRIEVVDPLVPGPFVDEHVALSMEAFARRGRKPPFGADRIKALVRHLGPTGHLLLLRATGPGNTVLGTGIFPGLPGATATYWTGTASRSSELHASEALMWEGMRRWRDLGATRFDFGGGGPYKAKFGGEPHELVRLHGSRYGALDTLRRWTVEADRRRRLLLARRASSAGP